MEPAALELLRANFMTASHIAQKWSAQTRRRLSGKFDVGQAGREQ